MGDEFCSWSATASVAYALRQTHALQSPRDGAKRALWHRFAGEKVLAQLRLSYRLVTSVDDEQLLAAMADVMEASAPRPNGRWQDREPWAAALALALTASMEPLVRLELRSGEEAKWR